jgi:TIR domain
LVSVFFSYSHKDESFRDELENHLAVLKHEGVIEAWHDRKVDAGSRVHDEISDRLESASIILLMVSSNFLASDYCYDRELARALERHERKEAVVIPVIVQPCDWQHSDLKHLRATPPDGKPISKFPNPHDAYLAIVTDVRKATERFEPVVRMKVSRSMKSDEPSKRESQTRSSNLRLKREFTDHDRDTFLDSTFEFISNYFENSLHELKERNQGIDVRFSRYGHKFTAAVYRNGAKQNSCRISLSDRKHFSGGITYSRDEAGTGFNESLNVVTFPRLLHQSGGS